MGSPTAWATKPTMEKRGSVFPQGSDQPVKNITSTHCVHSLRVVEEGPMGNTFAPTLRHEQLELARGPASQVPSTCPLHLGEPSFIPASPYRCTAAETPVWSVPSRERGV